MGKLAASGKETRVRANPLRTLYREHQGTRMGANPVQDLDDNAKRHGSEQTQSRVTLQRTETPVKTNPKDSADKTQRDAGVSKPRVAKHRTQRNTKWEQTRQTSNIKHYTRRVGANPMLHVARILRLVFCTVFRHALIL